MLLTGIQTAFTGLFFLFFSKACAFCFLTNFHPPQKLGTYLLLFTRDSEMGSAALPFGLHLEISLCITGRANGAGRHC